MSLRIGVDAREWVRGQRTGIGRYLEEIVRRGVVVRPRWRWELWLDARGEERVEADQVGYQRCPRGPGPWVDRWAWSHHLRSDPPEVFFSPYLKIPPGLPCPTVAVVHDVMELSLPPRHGGLSGWQRPLFRAWFGPPLRRADRVVSVSAFSAAEAVDHLRLSPDLVQVVPQQVDALFTADGSGEPGPLPLPGLTAPYCLAVGNMRTHKNIPVLLRAWPAVRAAVPEALLVLVGGADRVGPLRGLADRLGVGDVTLWLEGLPPGDLARLYRGATALLQPSYMEGFGLPVLEAMSCGTPVVVAAGGSLPEVVAGAAPVLDPEDEDAWARAVVRLLTDPGERELRTAAGLRRAADFRPQLTTDRLLDLLAVTAGGV